MLQPPKDLQPYHLPNGLQPQPNSTNIAVTFKNSIEIWQLCLFVRHCHTFLFFVFVFEESNSPPQACQAGAMLLTQTPGPCHDFFTWHLEQKVKIMEETHITFKNAYQCRKKIHHLRMSFSSEKWIQIYKARKDGFVINETTSPTSLRENHLILDETLENF